MNLPRTPEEWATTVHAHLMQTFHACPATAQKLLDVAAHTLRQGIHNLEAALNAPSIPEKRAALETAAHFLKGALNNMGLMPWSALAQEIERLAAPDTHHAQMRAHELLAALRPLVDATNSR